MLHPECSSSEALRPSLITREIPEISWSANAAMREKTPAKCKDRAITSLLRRICNLSSLLRRIWRDAFFVKMIMHLTHMHHCWCNRRHRDRAAIHAVIVSWEDYLVAEWIGSFWGREACRFGSSEGRGPGAPKCFMLDLANSWTRCYLRVAIVSALSLVDILWSSATICCKACAICAA